MSTTTGAGPSPAGRFRFGPVPGRVGIVLLLAVLGGCAWFREPLGAAPTAASRASGSVTAGAATDSTGALTGGWTVDSTGAIVVGAGPAPGLAAAAPESAGRAPSRGVPAAPDTSSSPGVAPPVTVAAPGTTGASGAPPTAASAP